MILVERMKTVLVEVISSNQSAFISSGDITDNILLSNELLGGYNRKNIS